MRKPPRASKQQRDRPLKQNIALTPEKGVATASFPNSTVAQFGGQQIFGLQHSQLRQSPYPPVDEAQAYEVLSPGSFDRILTMTEKQQSAQIQLSLSAMQNLSNDTKRGHYLGASVALGALAAAVYLGYSNHDWLGAAALSVPVMSVAHALIGAVRGQKTQSANIPIAH